MNKKFTKRSRKWPFSPVKYNFISNITSVVSVIHSHNLCKNTSLLGGTVHKIDDLCSFCKAQPETFLSSSLSVTFFVVTNSSGIQDFFTYDPS